MRTAASIVGDLKEIINQNRESLDDLARSWYSEQRTAECLRKIKSARWREAPARLAG
jgi:hypothetical protein